MTIKREWSYEADPELWSAGDADQRTSYNSCVHQRRGQGKGHKALNALCFCLQYSFVTIFLIVPFSFWFWLKNWKIFFPKVLLFKCVKSWGSLDTNGESHNPGDGTGISREMNFLRPNLWVKIYLFRRVIGRKVKKIKLLVKKKIAVWWLCDGGSVNWGRYTRVRTDVSCGCPRAEVDPPRGSLV